MFPITEIVSIEIGGRTVQPVSVAFRRSLEDKAGTFDARIAIRRSEALGWLDHLKSGPKVTIRAGSDVVFTGHVERIAPRIQSSEGELSISGRSKTGDVVDSAAEHEGREFRGKKPEAVIGELAGKVSVQVRNEAGTKARDVFRLEPDDTIGKAADRWARRDGFAVTDDAEGNLRLYDAGNAKRCNFRLIEGFTIAPDGSAVHDLTKRFSEVRAKAQAPTGSGPLKLEIDESADDATLGRRRVKVIVPVEEMNKAEARERAKWFRDRAAGKGTTAEVTTAGWRDDGGKPFETGPLIYTESEWLGLAQDMLIQGLNFQQDQDGGTRCSFSLVDPRAWKGKKSKGGKGSKAYDVGEA